MESGAAAELTPCIWTRSVFDLRLCLNFKTQQCGCSLSPMLYTLFTHDCVASQHYTGMIKFADDASVIGLIYVGEESAYGKEMAGLVGEVVPEQ